MRIDGDRFGHQVADSRRVGHGVDDDGLLAATHRRLVHVEGRKIDPGVSRCLFRYHQRHAIGLALRLQARRNVDVVTDGREIG